jgi:hypothetical protein
VAVVGDLQHPGVDGRTQRRQHRAADRLGQQRRRDRSARDRDEHADPAVRCRQAVPRPRHRAPQAVGQAGRQHAGVGVQAPGQQGGQIRITAGTREHLVDQ